jgi:hypothetical protein
MRRYRAACYFLSALFGLAAGEGRAQSKEPASCPRPKFALSRYKEDYAFLKDPACRTEIWDPIKYIPIVPSWDTYLSLGGDLRERYELLDHPDFSKADRDTNGYFQRYMLHADLHLGEHLRGFAQLKRLEDGERGSPPDRRGQARLHQAFGEGKSGSVTSARSRCARAAKKSHTAPNGS